MAVLINRTAIRALVLALILAGVAALMAPRAFGEWEPERQLGDHANSLCWRAGSGDLLPTVLLADEWSWQGFVKFWERQAGSMTGVVGSVLLVGAGAVLLILYKGKG